MYKIYVNGELFCDSRLDELAIVNPVVTLEVNAAGSFEFVVTPTHPYYDKIKKRTSVISVYRDEDTEPIFQGTCVSETVDFFKQKKITCEGELSYLNDSILRPQKYQDVTVLTLLTSYIQQHNEQVEEYKRFEIGNVTVTDPNNYIFCYTNMNPTLKEIKEDLLDDLGGFLRVRYENGHKYIDYLAQSTKYSDQVIELGKNLTDYNSNLSSLDVATRIIPLGARQEQQIVEGLETRLTIESVNDGKDYLQSDTAIEEYGIITKTVEFDGINTPSLLKTRGEQYLSEVQFENIFIEVKAVDFGYITDSIDKFELMDNIHIVSPAHGMDKWFMLSKMTLNLNDPERDVFVLGKNEKKGLSVRAAQTNSEVIKKVSNLPSSTEMLQAIAQATALITGAEGGNVVIHTDKNGKPYEFLVMDTDNIETAEDVWRWNINGLGHSSTGYNGTYTTAWTIDGGFNADFINSGTIRGVKFISTDPEAGHSVEMSNGIIAVKNIYDHTIGRITKNRANEETSYEGTMGILATEYGEELVIGSTYFNEEGGKSLSASYHQVNRGFNPEWAKGYRHLFSGNIFSVGKIDVGTVIDGKVGDAVGSVGRSANGQMMVYSYENKPLMLGYTKPDEANIYPLMQFDPSADLYPRWGASTWSGTIPISGLNLTVRNGLITNVTGAFSHGGTTTYGFDLRAYNGDGISMKFDDGILTNYERW